MAAAASVTAGGGRTVPVADMPLVVVGVETWRRKRKRDGLKTGVEVLDWRSVILKPVSSPSSGAWIILSIVLTFLHSFTVGGPGDMLVVTFFVAFVAVMNQLKTGFEGSIPAARGGGREQDHSVAGEMQVFTFVISLGVTVTLPTGIVGKLSRVMNCGLHHQSANIHNKRQEN